MNEQTRTNPEPEGRIPFLKTFIAIGVLTALGYLGNVASLPVAFGVSFLFGSIFVIIAISLFGLFPGALSALIASSYTHILWNHPYAIIIFVCEALWLGFFLKRKHTNIVLIDAAYWLVIGLPLVFSFYFGVMSLGLQSTAIIFLKQSVNGIINALIASILISHLSWQKWFRLPAGRQTVPYSQIIFQLTSAFLMLPLVGMLLFTNYQEKTTIQTVAGELLVSESKVAADLIHSWLERHTVAVKTIAELGRDHLFQPSEKLQAALEQINSLFPDIHAVFIADPTATTVAFIPAINEKGESTIGMNFADRESFKQLRRTLKPVISDVFQGRGGVFVPIFTVSVPIVAEGELSGFGLGALNIDKMRNLLSQCSHDNNLVFTVVDQNNNIVCSTNPKNPSLTPFKTQQGQTLMIGKGFSLWTPSSKKNISIMDAWKDAAYFSPLPIAGTTWTLLTEMPIAPLQVYLYQATIMNLALIFCFFIVAIILSQVVSMLLVRTPVRLAAISRDIPDKLEKSAELTWPESNITEMSLLINNFKETTQALSLQYQTLKDMNIHLDERVQERTAELRKSEERFRSFVENANAIIYSMTAEGILTYVSPNWTEMLGHGVGEVIGQSFEFVVHPDDIARRHEFLGQVIKTGEKQSGVEYRVRHKNGEWRWHTSSATPLRDAGGNITSYVGVAHDITERKRAEEALQKSEERFKDLYDSAPVGYHEYDAEGRITNINQTTSRMLGYSPQEMIGHYMWQFNVEEDIAHQQILEKLAGLRPPGRALERTYRRKDGTTLPVLIEDRLRKDEQGRITGIRCTIQDITERKRAEEEKKNLEERLQHAEKMEAIGTLAGGVAHDLNNLLGALVGNAEILILDMRKTDPLRQLADAIMASAERAAAEVQDLLTMARRGVVLREPASLNRIVADLLKTSEIRKMLSSHPHVTIETQCDRDLLDINASAIHIERTLTNLISNALCAIPGKGTITVRTENRYLESSWMGYEEVPKGEYAVLSVSDTGGGILPEYLKHLFEPFYMRKMLKQGGTGLGLSVIWGALKDHDGYMDVNSDPGKGTTFTLYFPVTRDESVMMEESPAGEYRGNGETILVVDDEEEQCRLAARMLTRLNYRVKTVESGEEALEHLANSDADLIVLDMIMDPGMDGYETYRRIREIKKRQKAIIFSGFTKTERVKMAQELGAGEFIMKPYLMERLGAAVRKELDRK